MIKTVDQTTVAEIFPTTVIKFIGFLSISVNIHGASMIGMRCLAILQIMIMVISSAPISV